MTDWQRDLDDAWATIEELTRERDEARATIERMKPVVDVAMIWFDSLAKSNLSTPLARNALIEVIATYVETDP